MCVDRFKVTLIWLCYRMVFCMCGKKIVGRIFPIKRRIKRAVIDGRAVYIIELPEEFNHIWRELYENNREVTFFIIEEDRDEVLNK